MALLSDNPIQLKFTELPEAIGAEALAEHYKLYLGYREMLKRIDGSLGSVKIPGKHAPESAYSGLLWGQSYALNGAYLHELFFGNLSTNTLRPMVLYGIEGQIERQWGSKEQFWREAFMPAALQARGWVILAGCRECPEDLRILVLDAHDLGPVFGYEPLLVIDMYEHSYWMDHGNDRKTYLEAIQKYIDWTSIEGRYRKLHPFNGSRR